MNLPLKIARRYLFSKKSHSAINIISMVSVCGVAITTMALICTLSIYNGFQSLIASLYSAFDPQIELLPAKGKVFDSEMSRIKEIATWPEIEVFSPVLEENALLMYRGRQMPALIKGVSDNFVQETEIESLLIDGEFVLEDSLVRYATVGVGLANLLGTGAHFVHPLEVYTPKRNVKVNLSNPMSSFNKGRLFLTAVFSVNQQEYDDRMAIVSLDFAREMFDYTTEVSSIELKLTPGVNESSIVRKLEKHLGADFVVKNRIQQQEASFKMMQIEKWMTFLILGFILMIASFNIVGSLSMLIIEKQKDIKTLMNLGASESLISKVFLIEGWLISLIGAGSGLLLGVLLCLLQQEFGLLQLGQTAGAFVVDAYPVKLEFTDIVIVLLLVSVMGFLAAWYPVRYLRNRWLK